MSVSLARRLREATSAPHRQAERRPFMADLIAGRCGLCSYLQLLHNLLPIYQALEPLMQLHEQHPWVGGVWSPLLARRQALVQDIAHLQGLGRCEPSQALAASQVYAQHLTQLLPSARPTEAQVARLLAHAYVRYLGDLSGGQVLQRVVARSLGLSKGLGTAFYDFGPPEQVLALRQRFVAGLEALPAHGECADAAVNEACWSFSQHLHLFDELAGVSLAR